MMDHIKKMEGNTVTLVFHTDRHTPTDLVYDCVNSVQGFRLNRYYIPSSVQVTHKIPESEITVLLSTPDDFYIDSGVCWIPGMGSTGVYTLTYRVDRWEHHVRRLLG
jgi:hypothetical protein